VTSEFTKCELKKIGEICLLPDVLESEQYFLKKRRK